MSSISGSASSSSSGESQRDRITKLLAKAKKAKDKQEAADEVDSDEEAEITDLRRRAQLRTAVIWFTAPNAPASLALPPNTQFGVIRALFRSLDTASDYLGDLRRLQLGPPVPEEEERRITLLMVAGGHFAGMVVRLRPRGKSEKQEVKGAGDVCVLKHKTFHRYTSESELRWKLWLCR